jgi:membrane protein DedA with SNARE-associated domain
MSLEQLQPLIGHYGYAGIILLLMFGIIGLPIPDETLLTLVGYFVFRGTLQPIPSFCSAFIGTSCGISASFAIGRFGGRRFVRRFGRRLHITPERMSRVRAWFKRHGRWSLPLGYFVPGVRHLIAIIAGSSGLEIPTFAFFAYVGAFVWSGVFITAGYYLGEGWAIFPVIMRRTAIGLFIIVLLGLMIYWALRRRQEREKS